MFYGGFQHCRVSWSQNSGRRGTTVFAAITGNVAKEGHVLNFIIRVYNVYLCGHVCVIRMYWDQKTNSGSVFSPSIMWALGTELWPP